ncbi:hypothetical protein ASPWEDRAFT_31074 [Aspergillus wentii DTO 134E9]|uniref:Protein kinase domain-containing protein n=1 Tax=Aspergillus wentii DTO 134E9 TaxID=1073089 RepID=A0A1L9RB80_ASPWE|nr:uncharacterized protein ASPWEDRAFT_31074 [Aspergillus wentii DTO 134E9]KAI9934712.1 hypothetical protein MW887_000329 [Aspergillus wentii]OJJ32138.1 hypothetical protein ASPWEDRAFT_31074 [Aspergillus wentii DTO 134E9]
MEESQGDNFKLNNTTVSVAEIEFLDILKESDSIVTWHVSVRGQQYVMKVYHTFEDEVEIDFSLYRNEATAYQRLQFHGLCDRGCIPCFYGAIESLNPAIHPQSLSHFIADKLRPSAVLIEYVPGMRELDMATYTKGRWAVALDILKMIHQAGVVHEDATDSHNVMVCPESERVLWIDFDRARTVELKGEVVFVGKEMQDLEFRAVVGIGRDLEDGQVKD